MTKTINGLTVTTSAASGDFLAIWRAANSDTRKITKANFMGGVLSGGGTIATGGFTGTLPATGTLGLLGTAQTFSALKTFSAGIAFAHETLNYYDEGTWTPAQSGVTLSTSVGTYTRIGRFVMGTVLLTWPATADATVILITGLPFTPATLGGLSVSHACAIGYTTYASSNITAVINSGSSAIVLYNYSGTALTNANLSGASVRLSFFYTT